MILAAVLVDDEVAFSEELEAISDLVLFDFRLCLAVLDFQRVGIHLLHEIAAIIRIIRRDQVVIEARFHIDRCISGYPVERPFTLRSAPGVPLLVSKSTVQWISSISPWASLTTSSHFTI